MTKRNDSLHVWFWLPWKKRQRHKTHTHHNRGRNGTVAGSCFIYTVVWLPMTTTCGVLLGRGRRPFSRSSSYLFVVFQSSATTPGDEGDAFVFFGACASFQRKARFGLRTAWRMMQPKAFFQPWVDTTTNYRSLEAQSSYS